MHVSSHNREDSGRKTFMKIKTEPHTQPEKPILPAPYTARKVRVLPPSIPMPWSRTALEATYRPWPQLLWYWQPFLIPKMGLTQWISTGMHLLPGPKAEGSRLLSGWLSYEVPHCSAAFRYCCTDRQKSFPAYRHKRTGTDFHDTGQSWLRKW